MLCELNVIKVLKKLSRFGCGGRNQQQKNYNIQDLLSSLHSTCLFVLHTLDDEHENIECRLDDSTHFLHSLKLKEINDDKMKLYVVAHFGVAASAHNKVECKQHNKKNDCYLLRHHRS